MLRTYITQTAEPPPVFYLALVVANAPSPYVTGSELDEPSGSSYSRVALPNDAATWSSDSQQLHILTNTVDIQFVTAQESWGRISYWALCNAITDGYVFSAGQLEQDEIIDTGDQFVVTAGEIVIELGPFFTPEEF